MGEEKQPDEVVIPPETDEDVTPGQDEEGAPPPPDEPPEKDEAPDKGEDEDSPGWKQGYTEGTQKYAEEVRKRDEEIARLRASIPPEEPEAPSLPPLPEGVDENAAVPVFEALMRRTPAWQEREAEMQALRATTGNVAVESTLARLKADPQSADIVPKVEAQLRGLVERDGLSNPVAIEHIYKVLAYDHLMSDRGASVDAADAARKAKRQGLVSKGRTPSSSRAAGRSSGITGADVLSGKTSPEEVAKLPDAEQLELLKAASPYLKRILETQGE